MDSRDTTNIPIWLWLGFPVILYFGHYLVRAIATPHFWNQYILTEFGFTEEATIGVLILALLVGIDVVRRAGKLDDWRLRLFFIAFCLGCLYFAGEEASWGQHWFGWGTPADWDAINGQDETNLHNLNGVADWIFNLGPRDLLSFAALIGGAIVPLVRLTRRSRYRTGSFFYWVMPGLACVPAGLIASLSTIPQKIAKSIVGGVPWPMDITAGEVKELMIAVFLLVYICSVWAHIRESNGRGVAAS